MQRKNYQITSINSKNTLLPLISSAVSSDEIDIGVETAEKYQHKGLALAVSTAMIQYILEQNQTPVWACHYNNIPSAKLAERSGFQKISECYVIRRKDG